MIIQKHNHKQKKNYLERLYLVSTKMLFPLKQLQRNGYQKKTKQE
jgi:hypothetical protein